MMFDLPSAAALDSMSPEERRELLNVFLDEGLGWNEEEQANEEAVASVAVDEERDPGTFEYCTTRERGLSPYHAHRRSLLSLS